MGRGESGSPVGTAESLPHGSKLDCIFCCDSVVPTGLGNAVPWQPSDKSLGYFQTSLRDNPRFARCDLPIKIPEEPYFLGCGSTVLGYLATGYSDSAKSSAFSI